ncbi:uncharacterized protein N0V89_002804 [Didymosphaeria variabile]|uniref:Erythromycin biosynthesis protein CIII-like C-terminal domain-containing protein n=1 Tax=Didymosphaeria variabile TaxID=1932322 RepID=A0A9W9CEW6_9PLEO|nr:uncharacterized protein N0V89_002804 [Didymosphaeria variabile]KAJ4358224.1 hypothetical protein N0V89_002804 [Didymosphaeria variabile]
MSSPALIPKPKDWGNHISIAGFFFLSLAHNYTPAPDLAEFLAAGEPPVYIGFGSIVVDDPNAMTTLIFDAVKATGKRALVSKGWGGLGGDDLNVPEGVFMLGNVPHDWLFQHVAAVVHHGGAGTTAAGIAAGRPTVVVPFFGDQPFWGSMVAKAGAGPEPIPYKDLTAEKLADAIREALKPESLAKAAELSAKIAKEQGAQVGAQSFHQMLKYDDLRFRPREYMPDEGPWDPITGAASALVGTAGQMMMGVADFPIETLKLLNIHPDSSRKGKGKAKQTENDSTTESGSQAGRGQASRTTTNVGSGTAGSIPAQTPNGLVSWLKQWLNLLKYHILGRHREIAPVSNQDPAAAVDQVKAVRRRLGDRLGGMDKDSIVGTGKGVGRIVGAGFKSPLDFSMNVAQGFHNVPKLYGGDVRQVDKVTNLQSGLKVAAKQFGFGLYDGIAGLALDPYKGAKKEGGLGFVKGVGRGIFSVPFRVMGGAFSVPAYAMKGLYQEMLKNQGSGVQNYVIAARISQGYDEASVLSTAEKQDIVNRWRCIKTNVKKKKNPGEEQFQALHSYMSERREKKEKGRWAKSRRQETAPGADDPRLYMTDGRGSLDLPEPLIRSETAASTAITRSHRGIHDPIHLLHHARTYPEPAHPHNNVPAPHQVQLVNNDEAAERHELETAIKASVAETSRGNSEEDELIARAIRASMVELQREPESGETEEQALQRAMTASMEEAQKSGVSEEEQRILEDTLRSSMLETSRARREHGSDSEWDSSDTEDDEEYQRILAESEKLHHLHSKEENHDEYFSSIVGAREAVDTQEEATRKEEEEALRKAIEESERQDREHKLNLEKQRTEEDIVMEYVKKQSLAEAQHSQRLKQGRDVGGESSGAGGSGPA